MFVYDKRKEKPPLVGLNWTTSTCVSLLQLHSLNFYFLIWYIHVQTCWGKAKFVTRVHHFRFMLFAEVLVEEMHDLRQVKCGKFCNDCWIFSSFYVIWQRLDFSWIPMYFYVKKLIPEIFYLFIRYEHRYVVTLLYHFLFWIFLIFSYFLKMFLYYISQDFSIILDMVDAHQRSREPSGRTKICNTCFIWQLYLCNTSHNLFLCNSVLPNSHREITPHVKSPLREERGLACP